MHKRTLARHGLGWSRPYGTHPFSPVFYADGGDGAGSGSSSDGGGTGGDGGAGGTGGTGQGAGQQGGQPAGQNGGNPGAGQGEGGDNGQDIKSLPAWAQQEIRDARAEAGKSRTTAKANAAAQARQDLAQEIGKALGLVKDDKPADPAELTRTISEQTGRIGTLEGTVRSLTIELASYKAAPKHGGDAAALLDSRSFLKSVEGLDPSDKDFATKLDDAIKAAVENNQQLRGGQAPRRGGGDFNGGPGAPAGRPTSLGQAIGAALSRG